MQENEIAQLKSLQQKIADKDKEIARLLHDRAELVLQIGVVKESLDVPIYNAEREKEVVDAIEEFASKDEMRLHLRRIYERILDESRALQLRQYGKRKKEN